MGLGPHRRKELATAPQSLLPHPLRGRCGDHGKAIDHPLSLPHPLEPLARGTSPTLRAGEEKSSGYFPRKREKKRQWS